MTDNWKPRRFTMQEFLRDGSFRLHAVEISDKLNAHCTFDRYGNLLTVKGYCPTTKKPRPVNIPTRRKLARWGITYKVF